MPPSLTSRVAGGLALVISLSLGCGNSLTSPTSVPPLPDGRYVLSLSGDPLMCGDVKTPNAGTTLTLRVTATHDGSTWIARASTPQDGTIELRLRYTTWTSTLQNGLAAFGAYYVAGTMSGSANDTGPPPNPPGSSRTATIADRTTIEGIFRPASRYADGFVFSPVTFSKDGVSSTCPAGQSMWTVMLER